jgi:hypothetical protein
MNYQCYDNFWYDPYPTYADCGGDEYIHMFTDALHSSVGPTTFSTPKNDESQYRAADVTNIKWFHPVGNGSKWFADNTGNLYNSKGHMVQYHPDPKTGKMVFTNSNSGGVPRLLPNSAVTYLKKYANAHKIYTSAFNNDTGEGMIPVNPAFYVKH